MSSEVTPTDGTDDSAPASDSVVTVLRALLAAVLLSVVGIGVGGVLVVATVLVLSIAGISITPLLSIIISLALATGIGFGGVAVAYLRYRGLGLGYVGIRRPSLREVAFVIGGYVASLGFLVLASMILSTIGAEAAPNTTAEMGMENPEILLLLIPASFLLIGPGEELLYRGVVQNRLSEALPAPLAIVLASLIFASIHYFSLSGAPQARVVSITVLVLPTLVFGTMYELTDNLVVPALIHGAYNATLFSGLYLAIRMMGAEELQQFVAIPPFLF